MMCNFFDLLLISIKKRPEDLYIRLIRVIKLPGRDLINKSNALLYLHVPSYAENELMHSEHIANIYFLDSEHLAEIFCFNIMKKSTSPFSIVFLSFFIPIRFCFFPIFTCFSPLFINPAVSISSV